MVTTRRSSAMALTVLVLGSSTSIPDCSTGAVIMKIISSTSTTSTSGVMLMSWRELDVRVGRLGLSITGPPGLGIKLLGASQELDGKVVHTGGKLTNLVEEVVIGDNGGDGGEEACRGGDEGFGDPGRDGAQGGGTGLAQPHESAHDAPHGSEEADEGRHRAGGGEKAHPMLEVSDLDRKSVV